MAFRVRRPEDAFTVAKRRSPRRRAEAHLAFIRTLPCVVCGKCGETEAAHVRYGDRMAGKRPTGMQEKPDDRFTVPLCAQHHRLQSDAQHNSNERQWWARIGIDPLILALALFGVSGDWESGAGIVRDHRLTATPKEGPQ